MSDEFVKDLHLKRKIVREGTLAEYEKNPNFLHEEKTELFSIAKEVEYNGVKWAMAIDLNKCIFCHQCVESCPRGAIKSSDLYELATTDKTSLIQKPNPNAKETKS